MAYRGQSHGRKRGGLGFLPAWVWMGATLLPWGLAGCGPRSGGAKGASGGFERASEAPGKNESTMVSGVGGAATARMPSASPGASPGTSPGTSKGASPGVSALAEASAKGTERPVVRYGARPVDWAYVCRGEPRPRGGPVAVLGRRGGPDAVLLLRFALALPPGSRIKEAFLRFERGESAEPDGREAEVRVWEVTEPWSSETVSWARLPRWRSPRLAPVPPDAGHRRVALTEVRRIDVSSIVAEWPRRGAEVQGLALTAEGVLVTGEAFDMGAGPTSPEASLRSLGGPYLDVYVY